VCLGKVLAPQLDFSHVLGQLPIPVSGNTPPSFFFNRWFCRPFDSPFQGISCPFLLCLLCSPLPVEPLLLFAGWFLDHLLRSHFSAGQVLRSPPSFVFIFSRSNSAIPHSNHTFPTPPIFGAFVVFFMVSVFWLISNGLLGVGSFFSFFEIPHLCYPAAVPVCVSGVTPLCRQPVFWMHF